MPVIKGNYWYPLNEKDYVEFEDINDASDGYDHCIALILSQPRWVLDNLDYVKEFQVPWLNYSSKEYCAKVGRKYAVSNPYFGDKE